MSFNIFRLDWILIDNFISIILIIFLIGVNILKKLYRWRFPLSNENLEKILVKTTLPKNCIANKWIKKLIITGPKNKSNSDGFTIIIIIRTFRKFMLLNALTEGLSTYGFKVINVWIKKYEKTKTLEDLDRFEFSDIIKHQDTEKLKHNNSYYLLVSGDVPFKNYLRLLDPGNLGIIILNPNMKGENLLNIGELTKLYGIFSEKSILFFKNPNLNKISKLKGSNATKKIKVKVIKSSKQSFRYYETILLGELINIFNNNTNIQKSNQINERNSDFKSSP